MTGSGSTMVAVIAPDAPEETVGNLKEKISGQFGETMWMAESGLLKQFGNGES
jgi:hypothetical protein